MLAVVREESKFFQISASIKEDFNSIENFQWQIADKLRIIRDENLYRDGGYQSFEDYCENELSRYDGYRHAKSLILAKKVIDSLPNRLKSLVKKPSHTRPLLRLVKSPEQLEQVVELAGQINPEPTAIDFAKAACEVVPIRSTNKNTRKSEKSKTQLCILVRVSSQSAIRSGEEGEVRDGPNPDLKFVTFADGSEELLRVDHLEFGVSERLRNNAYQETFTQAELDAATKAAVDGALIARKLEIEEAARTCIMSELEAVRSRSVELKEKNIQLQIEVDRLQNLQKIETENQRLRKEIEELKAALQRSATEDWGKPVFNNEAAKVLNREVAARLDKFSPELNLRDLALDYTRVKSQPEVLELVGQLLEKLTRDGIADYRLFLSSTHTWQDFEPVTQKWLPIKSVIWSALTQSERDQIKHLRSASSGIAPKSPFSIGDKIKILEGRKKGQELLISSVEENGVWARMLSEKHACVGPLSPSQFELIKVVTHA